MHGILIALVLAASLPVQPLSVSVTQERDALMLDFALLETLPEAFNNALPSGAVVRLTYPIQLRSERRYMWDKRVWKGILAVTAVFDPITGRYRCESVLDDVIVATEEYTDIENARQWLRDPPVVRLAMHDYSRWRKLRIRVRTVFSSSRTLLIFPSIERTDWVEVRFDDHRVPVEPKETAPSGK